MNFGAVALSYVGIWQALTTIERAPCAQKVSKSGREQDKIAKKTRAAIQREFGSYADHQSALQSPTAFSKEVQDRCRKLGNLPIDLQWVPGSTANDAEAAFIRINQKAAIIKPKELELIKSRDLPNAISARAIIRRGTGHPYWGAFPAATQDGIRDGASALHDLLFKPEPTFPLKSIDLPIGGPVYSATALRMLYDLVNLCAGGERPEIDTDGSGTLEYMRRSRRVLLRLCSADPSSLGLHPLVYFYSWTGKQQPIQLLTMTSLIMDLARDDQLLRFARVRAKLEEFIIDNRSLMQQVIRKFGSKSSGKRNFRTFYDDVVKLLEAGVPPSQVGTRLSESGYDYIQPKEKAYIDRPGAKFSARVKQGVILRDLLRGAPRCSLCGGIIPAQAISVDHKKRRASGGGGGATNAQLMHPHCNSGIKEKFESAKRS